MNCKHCGNKECNRECKIDDQTKIIKRMRRKENKELQKESLDIIINQK